MKILYGVQSTGNGHITRARALAPWFEKYGIEVDYLFSGRDKKDFWDMEAFGDWRCHRGLTFQYFAGKMQVIGTVKSNSLLTLYRDIKALDLSPYDVVLTDFEPITAWAARLQKKPCIGVGHQYAFSHDIPKRGKDIIAAMIMKQFAPVDVGLGLHWHHFNAPILPPIAETHTPPDNIDPNKIVVYLGFEEPKQVIQFLEPFEDTLFCVYGPFPRYESLGHIQLKPLSREGFQKDLASANGVICNAGFELSSEAIQLGKKLLLKPLLGQMEQLANAEAIEALALGMSMNTLDSEILKTWLSSGNGKKVAYPNVAQTIVEWLSKGDWMNTDTRHKMIIELWKKTRAEGVPVFESAPIPSLHTGSEALLNNV